MGKRARLLIILNLIIALSLVYAFSLYLRDQMPGQNAKSVKRFAGIMFNMDEIANNPESKTLFFGTSIIQYFLNPAHFDNRLIQQGLASKSYNLAFEGLFGPGQLAYTARMESEFKERHARFRTTIFELSPACLNRRFYDRHREMLDFVLPSIFLNPSTWAEMFMKDAPGTSYLLFDQFFRPASWTLLKSVGGFLGMSQENMRSHWPELVTLWSRKQFNEFPAWNPLTAGLSNWNFPRTKPDFDAFIDEIHRPDNWAEMTFVYARGNDVNENFTYSQRVVDLYIESVNTAAKFSERTYIVIFPYAPSFQKLADQFVDYDYLLKKISTTTNASIIDLRNALPLTDDDFADAMHLKHATMDRFSDLIADRVAADLQERQLESAKK